MERVLRMVMGLDITNIRSLRIRGCPKLTNCLTTVTETCSLMLYSYLF